MENNKLNIDVIVSDAGGAELLTSIVQNEQNNYNWRLVAPDNSPAKAIIERKYLKHLIFNNGENKDVFKSWNSVKPDYIFCGTGTKDFEIPFINEAQKRNIISVSFIDHWINYCERYGYPVSGWELNKPDFFALSDNRAYEMAGELNFSPLIKIKNYYINDLISELNKYKSEIVENNSLLFISEALEENCQMKYNNPKYEGFTQTEILIDILDNFNSLSEKLQIKSIIIRLHPGEVSDKFDYLKLKYPDINITIEKSGDKPLNECIVTAKAVVGIRSMALLIAFLLNKPTISYIPINCECFLPLPQDCFIHDLKNMPDIDNISRFEADRGLSFYEEFPLEKMIRDLQERSLSNV